MTSELDTLQRAWLKQLATQRGVTEAEWPALIGQLRGSERVVKERIRSMQDAEVLQIWHAARRCADAIGDQAFVELRDFTWDEVKRRANRALAVAG